MLPEPFIIMKNKLKQINEQIHPKYKYGIVCFEHQFNDSRLLIEALLTGIWNSKKSDKVMKFKYSALCLCFELFSCYKCY